MPPAVDVLMPAYNAAWSLPETLASIQAQTFKDIRIIVVDDGSTDDTAAVLSRIAALDPRIHIVTQKNGGIVAALNAGLAVCTAPLVARHDADDLSDPDRFERQVRYMEQHPDCVALAGAARHIDEKGRDLGTLSRLRDPANADENVFPASEPYLLHPMLMVRREAIEAVGGYRPVLHAEDSDLYWRLRDEGRLHNMAEVLGSYRLHAASVSSQSIFSGRQQALASQLAAISAQRRRNGSKDLVFDEALLNQLKQPLSLERIFEVGSRGLTQSERDWLALAVSAKLLGLCFYRPFELTVDDCKFIRLALSKNPEIAGPENAVRLREVLIGTSVRLVLKGMVSDAMILTWPKLVPATLLRVAFRVMLPNSLRDRIKRAAGRRSAVPGPTTS